MAAESFGVSTHTWIRYEQNSSPRMVELAILALSLSELKSTLSVMTELEKNTQLLRVNRIVSEIARIGQAKRPMNMPRHQKSDKRRHFEYPSH